MGSMDRGVNSQSWRRGGKGNPPEKKGRKIEGG